MMHTWLGFGCSSPPLDTRYLGVGTSKALVVEAIDQRIHGGIDEHQILREVPEELHATVHTDIAGGEVLGTQHHQYGEGQTEHHEYNDHNEECTGHTALVADGEWMFPTQDASLVAIKLEESSKHSMDQ